MQRKLTAAALGAAILCAGAGAAFAQGSWSSGSQPRSEGASNTRGQTGVPEVAPALRTPSVSENAGAEAFLNAARSALAQGRTGEAQEAMERAQTRLLDRSVPLFQTDQASSHPAIPVITQALRALGSGDKAGAMRYLDQALPLTRAAATTR